MNLIQNQSIFEEGVLIGDCQIWGSLALKHTEVFPCMSVMA